MTNTPDQDDVRARFESYCRELPVVVLLSRQENGDYYYYNTQARFEGYQAGLAARNEWQPIETAPKDGSLIALSDGKGKPLYIGGWLYGMYGQPDAGSTRWRAYCCGRFTEPSHWMPLQPPKE